MMNDTIKLINEVNCVSNQSFFEIIVAFLGMLVSLILVYFIIRTFRQTNKIHKIELLNDFIKREEILWQKISPTSKGSKIINLYENLSLLIEEKMIEEDLAKKMFKIELIENYKTYKENVTKNHTNLKKVYKRWKNDNSK